MNRSKKPGVGQLPLFTPQSKWRAPRLAELPSWKGVKRIGIDIETYDPLIKEQGPGQMGGGRIIGVSFAIEDGPAFYLPTGHVEDNVEGDVMGWLREQSKAFSGEVVGANLSYDLGYLFHAGVEFKNVSWFRDVMIADPLIYELHESYSLHNIGLRWGFAGKNEELLHQAADAYSVSAKGAMHIIPARFVGPYATEDARLPLGILRKQEAEIKKQEIWDIFNLESRVLPVLVKMRNRGIKIDTRKLTEIEEWSENEELKALKTVKHLTGVEVPIGSVWRAKSLVPVLEYLGVEIKTTAKGQPNIDKIILDSIDHEAARQLLWARKVNKLRTTFANSIRTHLIKGRIHCVFNQLAREGDDSDGIKGARYGRLSCEHPNMQQQPSRDEFATMWRSIYVPDEPGMSWAACDYSQQEPRVLTHFAVRAGCTGALAAAEKYRNDPNADNHQMMADITGLPRKQAKNIYLGLCYGMGGAKLATQLGLETKTTRTRSGRVIEVAGDEAQSVIDRFDASAPFVRQLAKMCEEVAAERGYIRTLLGRRCRFPTDPMGNFDWTHKALNRLIQGSSADQTKAAMVACDQAGIALQIQVHDELGLGVETRAQGEEVAKVMRSCVLLEVPSKVDLEMGPSWGEAK